MALPSHSENAPYNAEQVEESVYSRQLDEQESAVWSSCGSAKVPEFGRSSQADVAPQADSHFPFPAEKAEPDVQEPDSVRSDAHVMHVCALASHTPVSEAPDE